MRPATLDEAARRTTGDVGGAFPADVQADARRSGWAARAFRRILLLARAAPRNYR